MARRALSPAIGVATQPDRADRGTEREPGPGGDPASGPEAGNSPEPGSRAVRRRHALVVTLTFATGSADAMGFLALGGAFSSVMTGNMVLLGLSAGAADAQLALTSGAAILAFVVGLLVGAHLAGSPRADDPVWPRRVTRALLVELGVLLAYLAGWEVSQGHRSEHVALVLLMLSAVALGIQSSAVQRFGVNGLSSTYLTGTLTNFIGDLAARRPPTSWLPRGQVLLALMSGAAVSALTTVHAPRLAPMLCVLPLGVVALGARRIVSER
ncbi:DUF1275 family protein [Nocardioides panaciterrulae]|uniref:Uncharacterized membrane protein YoaK (UPF0700 family) n=1 Tax=Nocardioides panaciterrulae TaxID=661492 RepID=A0A7Y9E8T5_9ACTN|nr:uncharacterized membrane protein YoaK (UPF0700 family) [Nocardioides panaciterrulae]